MRVLVTGAAGFLGSWIAEALVKLRHEVIGIDNMSGGSLENVDAWLKEGYNGYFEKVDILDLDGLTRVCEGCEAVYHCAALAYEGLSVFSPSLIVNNIMGGTTNVGVAAARCGVRRVINCSSMARYGSIRTPYSEWQTPMPTDPYGVSKLAAEDVLNILSKQHGFDVVHVVPHNIYGPRQKYDDPYRNVAAIFANRLLQGKPPIIYGDGEQVRCFSYVEDVLPVMLAMLESKPYMLYKGEVFNVGPDNFGMTINELFGLLCSVTGNFDLRPEHHAARPCEVKEAFCSSDKIRQWFDWKPKTTLFQGLTLLVDYVKKSGPKPFDYHLPIEIDGPNLPRTWKERLM